MIKLFINGKCEAEFQDEGLARDALRQTNDAMPEAVTYLQFPV